VSESAPIERRAWKLFGRGALFNVSVRTRLLIAVGAVALVALVAADVVTYSALGSGLVAQADQTLDTVHVPLQQILDSGRALSEAAVASRAPGMFVEVLDPSGQPVAPPVDAVLPGGQQVNPALTPAELVLPPAFGPASGSGGLPESVRYLTVASQQNGGPAFRVRVSSLIGGYRLVLATPLTAESSTLHRLLIIELVVTSVALGGAVFLGHLLVGMGLRPLAEIEEAAEAIAAGDLTRRVAHGPAETEVARLARSFNTMVSRIQDAFAQRDATESELRRSEQRMRRFIADASHELRTPLAAVRAYAELFERGARDNPADLERLLAGIRSEAERMGYLVEDLMMLARLDEGRPLRREPVELVSLCAEAAEASRAVGPQWPISIQASEPVEVEGDPERLRQVVDNLLSNVRVHTPEGTAAILSVVRLGGWARIEVTDSGPGLSVDDAERAFERFYRADNARTRAGKRSASGAGLGLSIVAAIVHAHGGHVAARPAPGGGARFIVALPALRTTFGDEAAAAEGADEVPARTDRTGTGSPAPA